MDTLIFTFIVLLLVAAGMSVGVIMGRKPIAGSCGGMAALGMDTACDICGGDKARCDEEQEKQKNQKRPAAREQQMEDLAYEVKSNG